MNRSLPLHVREGNHHQGDRVDELKLPAFSYYLDESDPDVVVLRRQDGSFVAAFSASGFTKEGILEAAKEDYRALAGEYLRSGGEADESQRSSA
jgi:hypothetical protein